MNSWHILGSVETGIGVAVNPDRSAVGLVETDSAGDGRIGSIMLEHKAMGTGTLLQVRLSPGVGKGCFGVAQNRGVNHGTN